MEHNYSGMTAALLKLLENFELDGGINLIQNYYLQADWMNGSEEIQII